MIAPGLMKKEQHTVQRNQQANPVDVGVQYDFQDHLRQLLHGNQEPKQGGCHGDGQNKGAGPHRVIEDSLKLAEFYIFIYEETHNGRIDDGYSSRLGGGADPAVNSAQYCDWHD